MYQAQADFKPDKATLWSYPIEKDLRVRIHNKMRAEIRDMKAALAVLGERALGDTEKRAIQTW